MENHPQVQAYVKNQGLGLEVPYRMQDTSKTYIPDFIAIVDDGKEPDDPMHLIVEIKGYRGEDAVVKPESTEGHRWTA